MFEIKNTEEMMNLEKSVTVTFEVETAAMNRVLAQTLSSLCEFVRDAVA